MKSDVKKGERITRLLILELTIGILEHEAKPERVYITLKPVLLYILQVYT